MSDERPRLSEMNYGQLQAEVDQLYEAMGEQVHDGGPMPRPQTPAEMGVISMRLQAIQMAMLLDGINDVIRNIPSG